MLKYSLGNGDELSGVNQMVRVYVATKRKYLLNKMCGRHGNKGYI